MRYLDEFMSLKCCGDVMNTVGHLGHKSNAVKEITESMALLRQIRKPVLKRPWQYSILDLCAGNALTSVLSVYVLPVEKATAVDKRQRERNWDSAKRFSYLNQDIYNDSIFNLVTDKTIICSIHPCSGLAERVIEIYQKSKAPYLLMMPCCGGNITVKSQFLRDKLGRYGCWCYQLSEKVNGSLTQDENCISPKNIIITAKKGN